MEAIRNIPKKMKEFRGIDELRLKAELEFVTLAVSQSDKATLSRLNSHFAEVDGETYMVLDARYLNKFTNHTGRGDYRFFFQEGSFAGVARHTNQRAYSLEFRYKESLKVKTEEGKESSVNLNDALSTYQSDSERIDLGDDINHPEIIESEKIGDEKLEDKISSIDNSERMTGFYDMMKKVIFYLGKQGYNKIKQAEYSLLVRNNHMEFSIKIEEGNTLDLLVQKNYHNDLTRKYEALLLIKSKGLELDYRL